jgi:hypothetical protein
MERCRYDVEWLAQNRLLDFQSLNQAFYRFRQRYQTLLREEISHTVAMPSDIEDELRHLIAVVGA